MPWFQITWLLLVLVLAVSGLRAQRIGARKGVVMALIWVLLFVVAAGIAGVIAGDGDPMKALSPPSDAPSHLT
jgi:hypothetical protein